ncbi:hypothetical protein Syn7502_01326 [Synechococcus sp. PCC 7502]|uniref:DUF362 domain-containing protein n=1 Tax=Synechococcus sp. PCC 7502 TaxID=1173263 RepID=UPI00029FCC76|nr:DUF362 domain-containing protein [Synechococcus sp. PCC 7502]AFY73419.1 hypothetical protein Syn7502_01326 [Synechococcus sp. PCC 7502]
MKPTVSLLSASSYELESLQIALEQLLEPLGGMANIVKAGDRVLLKPNLLTGSRPTKECTTRPEIIYCVAKMVQAVGGKPFLGDSPAFGTAKGVAKANGLIAIAEELNIPIVEFHGQRYQTESDFQHLRLSKEAMDADVVINLPKVKSHVQLTVTMGVKNLFGCVPGKMKAWWHLEAGKDVGKFARMLVATAEAIAPSLTIMDGIIGHEGNGPSNGEPKYIGMLAASTDVFALDRVVIEVLGVNPELVPTLRVGKYQNLNQIAIAGTSIQNLQIHDWQLPTTIIPIDFGFPRVVKSTFRHLYIKFIKEPMATYAKS